MRLKTGLTAIVAVFFSAVVAVAQDKDLPQGPVAVPEEMEFVHPIVLEGEQLTHEYIIRNEGTEKLVISKVEAG